MKKLFIFTIFIFPTLAISKFALNKSCKSCHPIIFNEYQKAMHSKATVFKDPLHNALWKISPYYKQKKYVCATCHTPADTTMAGSLEHNLTMMPQFAFESGKDGVACSYCHRIKDIKHAEKENKNIINPNEKEYFGNILKPKKNIFHTSKSNKNFKNGNVCIGCHSHYKNDYGVNICSTNDHNELDSANCVSCHMPKIYGKPATNSDKKIHAYHGFAGIHNDIFMLSKYVSIEILRGIDRFFIAINNKSPHALTLHPMRVMELRVLVKRDDNITKFPPKKFVRLIGKNGKITTPWQAREIIKNTSIKGNEKRVSTYKYALKKGDIVDVQIGYYLINEKIAKKLHITNIKNEFLTLKRKAFVIKK